MSDRVSFPSTDSLSSGHCSGPHEALNSVGVMAAGVASSLAPDSVRQHVALVSSGNHLGDDRSSSVEGGGGFERGRAGRRLERRNTNDSFHSVGSSLHLWQT